MIVFHFILILTVLGFQSFASAKDTEICPHIIVKDGTINLNGNEKILVCGSDDGPTSWKDIPLTQIEFQMTAILQNMGYLQPRFERTADQLLIWRGPLSRIQHFEVLGAENVLDGSKKRKVINAPLNPAKLDEVNAWANLNIRSRGYPCPEIKVEARAWNESVVMQSKLGPVFHFGAYPTESLNGIHEGVLRRYQPFATNDLYDIRKTQIMTDRLLADGLFQSAFFETQCLGKNVSMQLKTLVGPAKIIRFGIGASTEELPFADLSFRNGRLDENASSITATLHGSPRLQSLGVDTELYWIPEWYRTFLAPRINFSREIESSYQTDTSRMGVDLGIKWDAFNTRFLGRGGPTLNAVTTTEGFGPTMTYPTVDASLTLMSHDYEYSMVDQFQGWTSSFLFRSQNKGLGSEVDVTRYEGYFKYLWNIGAYSPPFLVLGTRAQAILVETGDEDKLDQIPIEDRVFFGGDQNMRGFNRKSLNNFNLGYLSFVYLGFELRMVEELPYHLQPFLLWDLAKAGVKDKQLDSPTYVSEGFGIRWRSPFGTLKGSYARGRVFAAPAGFEEIDQWVLFVSFGQEF